MSDQSHRSVSAISYDKNRTCSISDNFCCTINSCTTFNVTHAIKIVWYCRATISYDFYRSSDISFRRYGYSRKHWNLGIFVDSVDGEIRGSISFVAEDNLAAHTLFGMTQSFGPAVDKFCHFCLATNERALQNPQSWSPRGHGLGLAAPRGQPKVSLAFGNLFPVLVLGFEPKSVNSLATLLSRRPNRLVIRRLLTYVLFLFTLSESYLLISCWSLFCKQHGVEDSESCNIWLRWIWDDSWQKVACKM